MKKGRNNTFKTGYGLAMGYLALWPDGLTG